MVHTLKFSWIYMRRYVYEMRLDTVDLPWISSNWPDIEIWKVSLFRKHEINSLPECYAELNGWITVVKILEPFSFIIFLFENHFSLFGPSCLIKNTIKLRTWRQENKYLKTSRNLRWSLQNGINIYLFGPSFLR